MTNPTSNRQNFNADDWIEIGTIVSPHGLKGELRVYSNTDFPERFEEPGERWLLRPNATELEPIQLLKGYLIPGKAVYVIQLAGVETREQVDALRDCRLMVPASDRPFLEQGEYYVRDLIGLEVVNQLTGETVGVVIDLYALGNDLLVVRPPLPVASEEGKVTKEAKILIPFVPNIVPVVNLKTKRIEITPPPGLLEISYS